MPSDTTLLGILTSSDRLTFSCLPISLHKYFYIQFVLDLGYKHVSVCFMVALLLSSEYFPLAAQIQI